VVETQRVEISALKAELDNRDKANSGKMSISSTSIASLPSTSYDASLTANAHPSSSNEDNVSLQSAQITSHTIDDNSSGAVFSASADSNVSSNKRGYSIEESGPDAKKPRTDDEIEDNPSVETENTEEDSNDVSATDNASSNYNQVNEEVVPDLPEGGENDELAEDQSPNMEPDEPSGTASSSQPVSRPSSIDFHVPTISSAIDPMLMQPGPSWRYPSPSTSQHFSTNLPLQLSHRMIRTRNHDIASGGPERVDQNVVAAAAPNAPPLVIIPPNPYILSPPNTNPNMNAFSSAFLDESEGIVPSTPILFSGFPPRSSEEASMISPHVPQAFSFITSGSGGATASASGTTPTISDTASSVISIDDSVVEYESNSPRPDDGTNQEEQGAFLQPTSSNAQSNQASTSNLGRPRKLRIRGLSRPRQP